MKRLFASLLALTLLMGATACHADPKDQNTGDGGWPQNVTIATATTGGTAYYIGAEQAQILNDAIDGVNFAAEATDGAPTMNGPIIQNDPACVGVIAVVAGREILNGTYQDMPGVALDKLRLVMVGHSTALQFVTLKETGITSLDQLKGKRIATSNPGTVVRQGSLQVLEALGYQESDFAALTAMTPADMADALKDGAIDVAIFNGGVYIAALADLSTTRDIVMMQVPQEILDKVQEEHPGYSTVVVPGGTYQGVTQDYTILGMPMGLWCNADMDEDLVYEITKALNESTDELAAAHTEGGYWNTENSLTFYNDGSVPFHPGAARYYDEIQGR